MIKRYFPILILSAICLAACSKKEEGEVAVESSTPIMAVVNETPEEAPAAQIAFRDPLANIVTDKSAVGQTDPIPQDAHFTNPMDRVLPSGQGSAITSGNGNMPDGMADSTMPAASQTTGAQGQAAVDSPSGDGMPATTNH